MNRIRAYLQGKKTYLTAVIAALSALLAWSQGQIGGPEFVGALFVAAQTCFLRAGIAADLARLAPSEKRQDDR